MLEAKYGRAPITRPPQPAPEPAVMPSTALTGAPPSAIDLDIELPEGVGYRLKRALLGPPLTSDQLDEQRLSKPMALGVLSSDCISSSAYGSEEMLLVLLPIFGIAAFTILLPLTGVILGVLLLVTLSYRSVVMLYTKAGGSYVVARDNFGPRVAQVAAVALMLDYVVTVAVQAAAGTAALASALPSLAPWTLEITVAVVVLLFYGNLRGIKEAGRWFAFPTYFFIGSLGVVILVGLVREITGNLPHYDVHVAGAYPVGNGQSTLTALGIFYLLKSFANGGSSLTGLEAISNGVGAFRPPEGRNARRTLVVMSSVLGALVAGVSWLAHETHATPFTAGTPTVISQVAKAVFGPTAWGHALFLVVQLATMLILYTGANTPFNGFPFLASFVAEDSFLPRQLTKRGHRLAFSNGIIVLAACSLLLILGTGAHVDKLVAFYAIGVFTGFTLAGLGMAKHFATRREPHWRRDVAINGSAGIISLCIVVIFAVAKFTEGAWLVLVVFPVLWAALMRLNRQYRREAEALDKAPAVREQANFARHVVVVLVDNLDLATVRAMRYARSLKPSQLRAVHFVIDSAHAAALEEQWVASDSVATPLELIECPDRRLQRAALNLAARTTRNGTTELMMLLPRRTYSPLLGRLLHDRTADAIAETVSKIPHVAATIVPFDVTATESEELAAVLKAGGLPPHLVEPSRVATVDGLGAALGVPDSVAGMGAAGGADVAADVAISGASGGVAAEAPAETTPIGELDWRERVVVEGRIASVRVTPICDSPALACELFDETGGVVVLFYGRRQIPGVVPGRRMRVTGRVGNVEGQLAIANPSYELLAPAAR